MKGLVDSHTHLDDARFAKDREEIIARFDEDGIAWVLNPGADLTSSERAVKLAGEYDRIYAAVGIHPHEAEKVDPAMLDAIRRLAQKEKVVAIGEIGLDYYYDNSPRERQKEVFRAQMEIARSLSLPVVIHSRDAAEDTYEILRAFPEVVGDLHCYSGSWEMALRFLDLGYYLGFGGTTTFKNARLPKHVVKKLPLERLLIETDAPYLTPEPHRGKRNEPAYVRYVAEKIAELRGMSVEEVIEISHNNARRLFGL